MMIVWSYTSQFCDLLGYSDFASFPNASRINNDLYPEYFRLCGTVLHFSSLCSSLWLIRQIRTRGDDTVTCTW